MAEIKYGHREGLGKGKEYPVAANQYFHNQGGHFVYLANGNINLCGSAQAKVGGWADCRKQTAGYNSWKSSSTAEADSLFVITGLDNAYELPWDGGSLGASLNASLIGAGVGLVFLATLTGETEFDQRQVVRGIQPDGSPAGPAATPLTIIGIDKTNYTVLVKISPDHKQAI